MICAIAALTTYDITTIRASMVNDLKEYANTYYTDEAYVNRLLQHI